MKQIATKILFAMKIDIKGKKISKVDLEIFRRRKISIADQHIRVCSFCCINQLTKETPNALGTIPAHNFWRNLIAHQMRQRGGMSAACLNAANDGVPNFCTSTRGIKKRDMLRPRNSRDHPEAISGGPIEKPFRRRSKSAEGIDAQFRHQSKIKFYRRNFGKGHAFSRKRERPV